MRDDWLRAEGPVGDARDTAPLAEWQRPWPAEPEPPLAPPPPPQRRRRTVAAALAGALVGGALGTALTLAVTTQRGEVAAPPATTPAATAPPAASPPPTPALPPPVVSEDGPTVVTVVADAVTPSVVRIDSLAAGENELDLPLDEPPPPPAGIGSGIVYSSDGYILTNHHVIEGGREFRVRLSQGDVVAAELIGSDPLTDLAVLKVDRDGLAAIDIRTDPPVVVGEIAIAIGSPFGLDLSVTSGVVSALNREIVVDVEDGAELVIPSVIQTDAAINPGNSGGALVDDAGRLIGMPTAIASRTGANQGVGFAVPAALLVDAADELIESGSVTHAELGVRGTDLSPRAIEQLDLDVDQGAVILEVVDGSPADDAGLVAEDVVVAVDGAPLATMSELVAAVRSRDPGDAIVLEVVRGDEQLTVEVTLGERG